MSKEKVVLDKVKAWLKEEVESQQDVVDAKDNGEDWATSDGTDDIIIGRHECAWSCLEMINKRMVLTEDVCTFPIIRRKS